MAGKRADRAEVVMMGLSAVHLLIFGIVAVLLFGNRLPGSAIRYAKVFGSSETECANFRIRFQPEINNEDQR